MNRHSSTMKKICIFTILALCLLCGTAFVFLWRRYLPLTYEAFRYEETAEELSNPCRGFYEICAYTLSEGELAQDLKGGILEQQKNSNRLIQIQVNLKNYRTGSISSHALAQLDDILAAWSRTDKLIILRFLYDWDGNAAETEPEDIAVIQTHMNQTASIFNEYAEHIFTLQGLFTGNYAEMHHSRFQSADDITILAKTLSDAAAPSIFLAVRTPKQWRTITGTTDPSALTGSGSPFTGRLGLFNDGMLGSSTDTGTYGSKDDRESELAFQNILCGSVPNGGEVIIDNPYNDAAAAIQDLNTMHVTYLNNGYDPAVLTKWKQTIYTGSGPFSGESAYDYISAHLGYRYVIRDSGIQFENLRDTTASFSLSVENTGFAVNLRPISTYLCLRHTGNREQILLPFPSGSFPSSGGSFTTLSLSLDVRDYPKGSYELYFNMTDDISGEQILLANDLSLTEYGYRIGTLTLGQ